MEKPLTKKAIVEALSEKTALSKTDVARLLAELTELAYREAARGFTLPGLCKFKRIRRAEGRRYNPRKRCYQLIAAHDILKVVPLKKAREAMAPPPAQLVIQDRVAAPARKESAPFPSTPKETAPPHDEPVAPDETGHVLFACPHCERTIMAHYASRGQVAQCPECRGSMIVPDHSLTADDEPQGDPNANSVTDASDFVTFVCRDCGQEIEAPLEMIGMETACPTCRSPLKVPIHEAEPSLRDEPDEPAAPGATDRNSMTIRMDLTDFK